ncbi:flagellar hook-length control protein FliK [Acetivibrio clariflavus]|uniref:Flagellar hook-length control protein FliK n=1 Tax=Acetivibrio clariflavus (strain DSM 19732 / NBRC 101661 / EBR45) TaxID=720554 RepID=G8LU31_ACECE|nr:flagellar hook-length control protein FliK [Acetivibrio clariflavus]AEV68419.1 Flagellar hook-length control protein FliK [Acetivibrio clariflavus DSM 19732]
MKIESIFTNLDINTLNMPDILEKLSAGDIIRAKVLDANANQLTLKLFDGTVFNARILSSIEAEQGSILDFIVKSNSNGQIVLETLKENNYNPKSTNDANLDLKKQLMELGIKPDKNNIEIAEAIKQNEIPLDKDIFKKISDTITAFKNVTAQKVAFLIANKIEPEKQNIALLNKIVDEKQKVDAMLKSTFEALINLNDEDVLEHLSQILNENPSDETYTSEKNVQQFNYSQEMISRSVTESVFSSYEQKNGQMQLQVKQKMQEFVNRFMESSLQQGTKLQEEENIFVNKALHYLKDNLTGLEEMDIYKQKSLENIIKDIFRQIKENTKEIKTVSGFEVSKEQSIKNQDNYKQKISEAFEKLYIKVTEKTSGNDLKINRVYKDIYHKLEAIKSVIEQSATLQKNEILNKIENLQSSIKFINDINNQSIYIQLPLNIQGKDTTGEIYVLKRKSRGKKIDPQNMTVFVSLNTPNLGQIDSLITVYKKNISLNIRVEEQSIISLIRENHIQLYNSLLDKGYKLVDIKYRLTEEVNLLNAESMMLKEIGSNKQSIDYKI